MHCKYMGFNLLKYNCIVFNPQLWAAFYIMHSSVHAQNLFCFRYQYLYTDDNCEVR